MNAPTESPAPKKRRWGRGCLYAILGGVGLIVVIIIIATIAGGGGGGGTTASS